MDDITTKHLEEHRWFNYPVFYDEVGTDLSLKVYVELGCWKGHSTSYLAKILKHRNDDCSLWAVDYWDEAPNLSGRTQLPDDYPNIYEIYKRNLHNSGASEIVTDIKGCTWEAANQFKDGSVDFVFVDADHSEEGVTKDILSWWPKLKSTGVIAGHDYHTTNKTGVGPAVRKLFTSDEFVDYGRTLWVVEKSKMTRDICAT